MEVNDDEDNNAASITNNINSNQSRREGIEEHAQPSQPDGESTAQNIHETENGIQTITEDNNPTSINNILQPANINFLATATIVAAQQILAQFTTGYIQQQQQQQQQNQQQQQQQQQHFSSNNNSSNSNNNNNYTETGLFSSLLPDSTSMHPVGPHVNSHNAIQIDTNANLLFYQQTLAHLQQWQHQQQQQESQNTMTHISQQIQPPPSTTQPSNHRTSNAHEQIIKIISLDQDSIELSPYQCFVRKQIELFEHQPRSRFDQEETTQGRNRPVIPGQVGIRCRHCGAASAQSTTHRTRGAILFPSTLLGLYQAAQNMANTHLVKTCKLIPPETREELIRVRSREKGKKTCKSAYGSGRQYWADSIRALGVIETEDRRLRFSHSSLGGVSSSSVDVKSPGCSASGGDRSVG